jgi:molecular chaperone DnaK (HSP70)
MRYEITLEFKADRELTKQEFNNLTDSLILQIQEPVNRAGDDEEYTTRDMKVAGWFNERE